MSSFVYFFIFSFFLYLSTYSVLNFYPLFLYLFFPLGNTGYGSVCAGGDLELSLELERTGRTCSITTTVYLPIVVNEKKVPLQIILSSK